MPVSEDEFERPVQMVSNQTPMSKAEQRKSNKPIMEKRRRARINHCLNELKTLILDAMKKDPARHSKLEKADILEMTVKHLQQIQRQQLATAVATDPAVIMRFKSGFDECAAEVSRYINRLEGIDNGVKQRLTAHLHRCVSNLQHVSTFPHQTMFSAIAQNCDKSTIVLPNVSSIPGDVNNNSNQNGERIQIQNGLQLIPSRLPTGELALLVPNSNHLTSFFGNATANATFQFPHNHGMNMNSVISPTLGHPSAFTAVIKNQEYPSPTSTADVIKKEASTVEEQDCKTSSFPSRGSQTSYLQNYNLKVTEDKKAGDGMNEETDFKGVSIMRGSHDFAESIYNCDNFKTYGRSDGTEFDQKTTLRTNSSSFQRTVADSTTSYLPTNKEQPEIYESGFKPFQVEIPNSHLKAHISISKSFDVKPSLQVHQKPNPNFTLNPNKLYHKSPYKFTRNHSSPENNLQELGKCEIGFEKFTKIEPICTTTKVDVSNEEGLFKNTKNLMSLMRSGSSETFQSVVEGPGIKSEEDTYHKALKREYLNESPEMLSPTTCSEPPTKMSRLSLNVTLTEEEDEEEDDRSRDLENSGNRCKRISVIVEDSSKGSGSEGIREMAAANVSSHKDMWRPW